MIEEHSVILYNSDKSLCLHIWYFGFTKEQIAEDIQKRFTGKFSRWTQYKYIEN